MALAAGSRFGAFDIVGGLGAGGMGEVYLARDRKLGRDVALKILPDAFAADPERLARFEREARVLAALNHPHIAQLHGIEESGATRALVMELVDGEDLGRRLAGGPLPIDEALPIAVQIAEAIDGAHELGIIHRDLKPANIKVRADGTVKVLDFGLAKALEHDSTSTRGEREMLSSPTITSPAMTMRGVILGTAAYMAPEQAKGKPLDKRVDIWAFGCVLYEMLTGRRPFPGEDISDTLAFVLTKDVDWSVLPPATPQSLRTLLRHCLQKNPKDRLRDIGDARLALREAMTATDAAQPLEQRSGASAKAAWAVAAAASIAAIALGIMAWRQPAVTSGTLTRFVIPPPTPDEALSDPLLSPDGSFILFKGNQLYVRRFSEFEPRALPGTEGARMPFLSPDGQSVGFFADGKLKKMLLAGGDPLVICDAPNDSPGAAWGPNNRILFTTIWTGGPLVSVSADGGPVTPVSTLDASRNERGHWWPEPLPDGRHVLFTIWFAGAGISDSHVAVLDLQTGRHRSLFPGADARYAAGHLVFFRAGAYQAVRFDPTTQTATSEPKIVLPDAVGIPPAGLSYKRVGLSASGNLGFVVGDTYPEFAVSWLSRDGHIEPTPLKLRHNGFMLSPDGRKLAYGRPQSGLSQIAIYDFASRTEQRLQSPGYNFDPVWHPDGQRVAFVSMRKGDFDIYVEGVGTAHSEALLDTDKDEQPVLWMPGGRSFIAWVWEPDGSNPMVLVDVATKAISPPLVGGRILKGWSAVSEDSRWLWFCARPADTWQLYVRSLSGAGTAQSLGTCRSSDQALFQSARTHEVIVARGTDLVALSYTDRGDRFIVLTERVVARIGATDRVFGISPDGQRFLIGKRTRGDAETAGIRVAINGLEALLNGSTP